MNTLALYLLDIPFLLFHKIKVAMVGLEPTSTKAADFLTTIVFTTFTVCGLDYTLIIVFLL
jgi:hypothetical protein